MTPVAWPFGPLWRFATRVRAAGEAGQFTTLTDALRSLKIDTGRLMGAPDKTFPGDYPSWHNVDSSTRERLRVLIVDDHDDTRQMYAWCMRAGGWLVAEAMDGQMAIVVTDAFKPHIIVMDLHMPVLDGVEACRRLKHASLTRHIPIVACTALDERARALAKEAGCNEVVAKPIEPVTLRGMLEKIINHAT
jgi:CheY-like chemotaxis protein